MTHHTLCRFLACPECKKQIRVLGKICVCRTCHRSYPIQSGIPILVDLDSLPSHLARQVTYFEKEDASRTTYTLEPWQKRYVENFITFGAPKRGGVIIDNATGSGYIAIELAKRGFRVIALDLTLKELLSLQRIIKRLKLDQKILLVCASSESLPIRGNCADGLVANAILEHLPNENSAAEEIVRVLKNYTPLMVAMPIRLLYVWPFLWLVNILHDKRIGHLRRYDRGRILSLFPSFFELKTYYTGSIAKIIGILLKIITKTPRWDDVSEKLDRGVEHIPYGSSNVVSILRKQ